MVVVTVNPSKRLRGDDGQFNDMEQAQAQEEPKDYSQLHPRLEAQLQRSRTMNDQLRPRNYKTWKSIMLRNPNFRWRVIRQPYSCDVCTAAPEVEYTWEDAKETLRKAPLNSPARQNAVQRLFLAHKDMSKLEQHRAQLQNQRSFLRSAEDGLPPKSDLQFKVVVYVDFVAQYNYRKKKVANLVFTIKWRDERGQLQYKYVDNFCSDESQKADCMYVKCAWEFHLRANLLRYQLSNFSCVLSHAAQMDIRDELHRIKAGVRSERRVCWRYSHHPYWRQRWSSP